MKRRSPIRPGLAATVALLCLGPEALPAQVVPRGCESAGRVAVDGIALGSSYAAARAAHPPRPDDAPARPPTDTVRVRYIGRGVYLGISADTIVSIGLEAPSTVDLCGVRVGHSRFEVSKRWGEPRSELPSAWLYGDSVGYPPRWVAVVYFGSPAGGGAGPADSVARVAVMFGRAP